VVIGLDVHGGHVYSRIFPDLRIDKAVKGKGGLNCHASKPLNDSC
jgi:hypothetical protein